MLYFNILNVCSCASYASSVISTNHFLKCILLYKAFEEICFYNGSKSIKCGIIKIAML